MQRIKLTRSEKKIFKHLFNHGYDALNDFSQCEVDFALGTLDKFDVLKSKG